ncbi:MAG: 30S ribosomal protein S6 [Candidatus Lambdaproteobacteria bacterium RIFOXYD2_FULL_50_16]|uniref:Small ribosomal subunit protein bS6 n=1 Tax=Candidatus Lambdaproteobacteria bacterium RIFOXYD2_FULL_50_16 TaxID=1817772 RepID=A0A1F6G9V9_9PROT|nr:MAG: 30S ribosomal protein S6 [Candidatus Lambdaproteobacteria bacterium RIFOXYD2_FULL_50_16]
MVTREYELMVVADGRMTAEENEVVLKRHREVIKKNGGKILSEVDWGRRKLSYSINKRSHGIYSILYLEANGAVLTETQKQLGYDEQILKFFVVQVDSAKKAKADFEALKAEPTKHSKLMTDIVGA